MLLLNAGVRDELICHSHTLFIGLMVLWQILLIERDFFTHVYSLRTPASLLIKHNSAQWK